MKPVRIAQIGVNDNSHGTAIYQTIKELPEIFELVGIAFPENEKELIPDKVNKLGEYKELTLDEILSDPSIEAVAVETDEIYLTKYAQLAADAGKHIHMEKPGGLDLAAFTHLVDTVKGKNLIFSVGYMYRFNVYIMELMRRIEAGELGEIVSIEAQMSCWHPEKKRHWLNIFPGGMMFFLGCHLTDLVYRILGEPERIIPLNKSTGMDGVTADDFGMAVLEYKNGVSFVKATDIERGGYMRRQFVVIGTKGTVELRPFEVDTGGPDRLTGKREVFDTAWSADAEFTYSEPIGRYDRMMISFADCVRGNKENPYTPDYELGLYKTILKTCGVNENV